MAKQKPVVLIMAGGSGTRFWPYSRDKHPKQFIDILGSGESLIQATFRRAKKITEKNRIFVATNIKYKKLVLKQLPEITESQILLEPRKKNTAPCITYASMIFQKKFGDVATVVTPSDHTIVREKEFIKVLQHGIRIAENNHGLVTIGIKPTRPETGYGYIQTDKSTKPVKKVVAFREKPSRKKAAEYVRSGNYLWNAGIFVWKNSTIRNELEKFQPKLINDFKQVEATLTTGNTNLKELKKAFEKCQDISIDYAVMEKAGNVSVIPGDFGWSDLGSWNAVFDLSKKDKNGNVIASNSIVEKTKNSIIIGSSKKLIVVEGLNDFLVADHENAILICRKDNEKEIREFVKRIAKEKGKKFT